MSYENVLLGEIYNMYFANRIGQNNFCVQCRSDAEKYRNPLKSGPIPIFHVGKEFTQKRTKLLIIGKVAYGWGDLSDLWSSCFSGDVESINVLKSKVENRVKELFYNGETVYFSFLKKSLREIFGSTDRAYNSVAITNFMHCNDDRINDYLRQKTRFYCASKKANGFVHKEISILKPSHIIVLTKTFKKKYERYLTDESLNIKFIKHPSSIGRTLKGFTYDIKSFVEKPALCTDQVKNK